MSHPDIAENNYIKQGSEEKQNSQQQLARRHLTEQAEGKKKGKNSGQEGGIQNTIQNSMQNEVTILQCVVIQIKQ